MYAQKIMVHKTTLIITQLENNCLVTPLKGASIAYKSKISQSMRYNIFWAAS